jgi:hypothetical protein
MEDSNVWWPMEGEGKGSNAWWPLEREGEGYNVWWPMEREGEAPFHLFSPPPQQILLKPSFFLFILRFYSPWF